jgi:hypothetical protein
VQNQVRRSLNVEDLMQVLHHKPSINITFAAG